METGKIKFIAATKKKVVTLSDKVTQVELPSGFMKERVDPNVSELKYKCKVLDGRIVFTKIIYNGRTYPSGNEIVKLPSVYNFVPLNDKVVYPKAQKPIFEKYDPERNTGYIEITLHNKTHFLISSGKSENNTHHFLKLNAVNKDGINNETPIVPGSSLRGLIKNVVEIVSYSAMKLNDDFENKALYFRSVFGTTNPLTTKYLSKLITKTQNGKIEILNIKVRAGYLYKDGNGYKIRPSEIDPLSGFSYHRLIANPFPKAPPKQSEFDYFQITGSAKKYRDYEYYDIYYKSKAVTLKNRGSVQLRYPVIDDYKFSPTAGYNHGKLIISGAMGLNKHYQWIVNREDTSKQPIECNKDVIKDYLADKERSENYNLFEKLKVYNRVPCFYLTNEAGIVQEIGHTGFFRIKHEHEIKDAVLQKREGGKFDFSQLLFGNTKDFASRVFFEDLVLQNFTEDSLEEPTPIKILSSPKPTSHQLYLEQPDHDNLRHWSSNGNIKINGYKQYWHKNSGIEGWKETGEITPSHTGNVRALKPGGIFKGRIRFDNLTHEELGALLFSLQLPQNCCHKMGMGKPYGLGTVQITASLSLSSRDLRYLSLLNGSKAWNLSEEKEVDTNKFKKAFEVAILSDIDNENKTSLWEIDRLTHLKNMLEFNEMNPEDWLSDTSYMELERFRNREVLPKTDEIIEG